MTKDKGIKIIIFLILLIIIGGSSFLLWIWREEKELGSIPSKEFSQKEINGEKIIENKKTGLKIKIPKGWQVEGGFGGYGLIFLSSDFKPYSEKNFLPVKGCFIGVNVSKVTFEITSVTGRYKRSYGADFLREKIEKYLISSSKTEEDLFHKVIEISGHKGLKTTEPIINKEISGKRILVEVPEGKRVCSFELLLFGEDKEKCEREFEEILNGTFLK